MLKLKVLQRNSNYPNLVELNLNSMSLESIDNIQYFPMLTILNLSFNKIANIKVLKYLTQLNELYLQHNRIREIRDLYNLKNLRLLDISWNLIKNVKHSIVNLNCSNIRYSNQVRFSKDEKSNKCSDIVASIKLLIRHVNVSEKQELIDYICNECNPPK
eukprot:NODE_121_length_18880_cov_0.205687.p8 type:complete len:159 gc:universal NODE_121_length_18880_cov_0.205687:10378-9902(-)